MSANEVFASLPVLESLARAVMSLEDPECWRTWLQLCVALPCFGRYSLHMWVQREAKERFTRMTDHSEYVEFVLPCGERHSSNDQPAAIWKGDDETWWVHGKLHRDNDQPAVFCPDGYKAWYINGKLHRDNGQPARIFSDGYKQWWVEGKYVKEPK